MSYYRPGPSSTLPRPVEQAFPKRWMHHGDLLAVAERDTNAAAELERRNKGLPPARAIGGKSRSSIVDKCAVCDHAATEGSWFCNRHTCRAINADGNRCPNLTPLNAAVCTHGYHADNKRHHYVERARAVREVYSKIEEDHREIEHIQLIEYFSSCFPGVATQSSPTASSSSLDSSPTTSTMSPLSGNSSLHLQQEKWEKANRPQPLYEIPPCQSLSRPPRQATGSSPHSVSIKGA